MNKDTLEKFSEYTTGVFAKESYCGVFAGLRSPCWKMPRESYPAEKARTQCTENIYFIRGTVWQKKVERVIPRR